MNITQLREILRGSGREVAYDHFVHAPAIPFILIVRPRTANMFADNQVYAKVNRWRIILCTELKDSAEEAALEAILNEHEIAWEIEDEAYIKEERVYQIIYEIEELEE